MKQKDAVELERLLADACSPAERSALMQRIDLDPELQAALCDALCEDVILMQYLAMGHAHQHRRRFLRVGLIAAAAALLAAIVFFKIPSNAPITDESAVVESVLLAGAGRHHDRQPGHGEWTYVGSGSLRLRKGEPTVGFELNDGLLHWRSSNDPPGPRSFAGQHLRVTPRGTALSLLDRSWGSLVQVHTGAVAVAGRDGTDHGTVEAGSWLRYAIDGSISRGQLLPDPVSPLFVVPFVPMSADTVVDLAHADGRYDFVAREATALTHDRHGTLVSGSGGLRVRTPVAEVQPMIALPTDMSFTLEIVVVFPQVPEVDDEVTCLQFIPCRDGEVIDSFPGSRWCLDGDTLQLLLQEGRDRVSICYVHETRDGKSLSRLFANGYTLAETRGTPQEDAGGEYDEQPPDAYLIELPAQVAADATPEERDRAMRYRSLRLYPAAFDAQTVLRRSLRRAWEMPLRAAELARDEP